MLIAGVSVWIIDNFLWHHITNNNSLFRMTSSMLITYLSFGRLHQLTILSDNRQFREAELLLISGLLLYHVYKTFLEAFHVFPTHMDVHFYIVLWVILLGFF